VAAYQRLFSGFLKLYCFLLRKAKPPGGLSGRAYQCLRHKLRFIWDIHQHVDITFSSQRCLVSAWRSTYRKFLLLLKSDFFSISFAKLDAFVDFY